MIKRIVVLGGGSAGAICWFEQACTDSRPGKLSAIDGLGWLSGSACPHFDLEKRRAAYPDLVLAGSLKDGLACDEGAGIVFEDSKLVRVVSALPKATAWKVARQDGKIDLSPLEAQFLGK